MRFVVHNNDMRGPIKVPTILIAESELTSAEDIFAGVSPSLSPMIVTENDLPDRWFQTAWVISGGKVSVNMEIARELHRKRMRGARVNKLAALDVEFQRALETGADTKDIVAKKQALRDVTKDPRIDAAQTTEQLRSVWPEILGDNYV